MENIEKDEVIVDVKPTPEELGEDTNWEKETPEKTEEETEEPKTSEPEKAKTSKELQSALAQKEHFRKKYEEAKKSTSRTPATDSEWKDKVEFLIKNRDYNEEEFDHIATAAQRKGVSLEEAAKAESEYIAFRREKVAKEKQTPSPSSVSSFTMGKKISPQSSDEEIDSVLQERFQKVQRESSDF